MTRDAPQLRNPLAISSCWSRLPSPVLEDLVGTHEAFFTGPALAQRAAALGLGPLGLPDWFGKRFSADPATPGRLTGINLLRSPDGLRETLPMTAGLAPSFADGLTALVVEYPLASPLPWRLVRDEFRRWDARTLAGLSFVDRPGLRALGLPFLLVKRS